MASNWDIGGPARLRIAFGDARDMLAPVLRPALDAMGAVVATDTPIVSDVDVVLWVAAAGDGTGLDPQDCAPAEGVRLVVALPAEAIDAWAGLIGRPRVELVPYDDPEGIIRAVSRRRPTLDRMREDGQDAALRRLRELSLEVDRIAQALGTLGPGGGVGDRRPPYRAGPAGNEPLRPAAIRTMIRARRLRDQFFASELFADPAWDILLDLMAARLEGRQVAVSSLCIAAAVPATTALRWIQTMTEEGLLVRAADPADRRRVFIRLSDDTAERLEACLRALFATGGAVA